MKAILIFLAMIAGSAPAFGTDAERAPVPAAQLLSQVKEAYQTMSTYRCSFAVRTAEGGKTTFEGGLMFARPNKLKLIVRQGSFEQIIASDGAHVYRQLSPKSYVQLPDASGIGELRQYLEQAPGWGIGVLAELFQNGSMEEFAGPMESVPARGVDRLQAKRVNGTRSLSLKLDFDPVTHLLVRSEVSAKSDVDELFNVTEFSSVQSNFYVQPGAFKFAPSEGARPISREQALANYNLRLKKGALPFSFKATDIDGRPQSLQLYLGRVVLLDFWATWCSGCLVDMAEVNRIHSKYHGKGFEVLGISADEDLDVFNSFIKQYQPPWPNIFSAKGMADPIVEQYGVTLLPFSLLIGRDGKIIAINPRGKTLEAAVAAALESK